MPEKSSPLSPKAMRKLRRRVENDAYAKDARFWLNLKSADRMGYKKPVNRQAAKELSHKRRKKP
jgi:hypothetical protein